MAEYLSLPTTCLKHQTRPCVLVITDVGDTFKVRFLLFFNSQDFASLPYSHEDH